MTCSVSPVHGNATIKTRPSHAFTAQAGLPNSPDPERLSECEFELVLATDRNSRAISDLLRAAQTSTSQSVAPGRARRAGFRRRRVFVHRPAAQMMPNRRVARGASRHGGKSLLRAMALSLGEFVPLPSMKRAIRPRVVPLASLVVPLASPRCPGSGRFALDVGCSSRDVRVVEGRRASSSRAALLALRQNPIGWTGSDPFAALRPSIGVQLWAPSGESMLRFLSYRPTHVRIANCIAVRIPSAPP